MNRPSNHCSESIPLFVAPLDCFTQADLDRAGGKGANLGELVRAGFPVPPGFAVTTAAYERFVTTGGLQAVIARSLVELPGDGAAIRAAFEAAPVPPEVTGEILAAYRLLGDGPVAVRSSATAEDLPEAAFAGQQDTYLNVVGVTALVEAVRRCWASLWTDRAIAYRARQGIEPAGVKLAVVVQRMVPAEYAGVMFTANALTGARDETLIDASPGLGEAVVSGLVTPDHYVLRRRRWGWQIKSRRAGRREVILRPRAGGGIEQLAAADARRPNPLPDRALRRLASLGAAIQRHFGRPQDIEWAWWGGQVFILQARPVTALPAPASRTTRVHRMVGSNFVEMLPTRPYPLDLDVWMPTLGQAVEPIFSLLGLEWSLGHLFEEQDGVVTRYQPRLPRPTWKTLGAPAQLLALILRYNPVHWQADPLLFEAQARARDLESRELSTLSWRQVLALIPAAAEITAWAGEIRRRYFPGAALAAARLRLLLALFGRSDRLAALLSGVENKTLEANRALERLAAQIRADATLSARFAANEPGVLRPALAEHPAGRTFLSELDAFLETYGHRETLISTALQPTWKDAPELVLGMIQGFSAHPPPTQDSSAAWQTAQAELLQHPLLRAGLLRAAFRANLAKARTLLQMREDTHFYATLPLPLIRRVSLELGRRLTAAGALESPEDVFHLRLSELERVGAALGGQSDGHSLPPGLARELHAAAARRMAARAGLERTPLIDPRLNPEPAPQGNELLRGMPGSPGVAEGPARIVQSGAEFGRLAAGDVLVAPFTNPSWTPLFQRAAAVVVDTGSPVSHAAIVAREYGIPAVMATGTGTRALRDGERVRVDGGRGIVYRLDPEDQAGES